MDPQQALDRAGPRAVASHESAARLWELSLLPSDVQRLTVPRNSSRVHVPGWRVHRADLLPEHVATRCGPRVTSAVRTVTDLATVLPLPAAVVAADSAVRLGHAGQVELMLALLARRGRGATAPRAVAPLVRADSGSPLEGLLWTLFYLSDLPLPATQFLICEPDGQLVARVDFCWQRARLVVEADGYAFHSDRAAFRRDRDRLNALERLRWRVLRFTWEDVHRRPEHVLALVTACLRQPVAGGAVG